MASANAKKSKSIPATALAAAAVTGTAPAADNAAWPFPNGNAAGQPDAAVTTTTEAPAAKTDDAAAIASAKEAQAKRDEEAKAAKQKAKDEKAAAKAKEQEAKKAEREAKKAERAERLAAAAEGREYKGSMLALADRVKQGVYVKGLTGQLHATDELGNALSGVGPSSIVGLAIDLLKLEDNPYSALNQGQQSMNLRNRLRGAIKKGTLTIADVTAYIERNPSVAISQADVDAKAKAKADAKAAREAKAAEAKAKAKTEAPVGGVTTTTETLVKEETAAA